MYQKHDHICVVKFNLIEYSKGLIGSLHLEISLFLTVGVKTQ